MVLRQSRKCEKTLREAVIQKHKSNGNAVEVFKSCQSMRVT